MAIVTRRREAKGSRVHWKEPIQRQLAKETAATLRAWGYDAVFSKRRMMQAFRIIMPMVLTPDKRRDIMGPGQVPWLEGYVIEAMQDFYAEEVPVTTLLLPEPLPITPDTLDLILDALTNMETRLASQGTVLEGLTRAVEGLGGDVKGLGQIIVKARKRAAEKAEEKLRLKAPQTPRPRPTALIDQPSRQ